MLLAETRLNITMTDSSLFPQSKEASLPLLRLICGLVLTDHCNTYSVSNHLTPGIEKLIFTVSEETNFIVFHSKNITITSRTINERLKVSFSFKSCLSNVEPFY